MSAETSAVADTVTDVAETPVDASPAETPSVEARAADAPVADTPVAETPVAETAEVAAETPQPIRKRQFRTAAMKSKLSADEANRQGLAVRKAFEVMGRDEARAFLNEPDEALGGRPLDVATASAAGMAAVEQAIMARGVTPQG